MINLKKLFKAKHNWQISYDHLSEDGSYRHQIFKCSITGEFKHIKNYKEKKIKPCTHK